MTYPPHQYMNTVQDAEHWYDLARRVRELDAEIEAEGIGYRDGYPWNVLIKHIEALGDSAIVNAYKASR